MGGKKKQPGEEGGSLVGFRLRLRLGAGAGEGRVRLSYTGGGGGGQVQVREVDKPEEEETSPMGAEKHKIYSMFRHQTFH